MQRVCFNLQKAVVVELQMQHASAQARALPTHPRDHKQCRSQRTVRSASLAPPEVRLATRQERRDALLVILAKTRQCELVDVHVAGEIVERVRQTVDG